MARKAAARIVSKKKRKKVSFASIAAGLIAALAIGGFFYSRRVHALTDKDTIVLADFANKTADPVFDDTLKEGISAVLSQSPFLNLMPEEKVSEVLKMMGAHRETGSLPKWHARFACALILRPCWRHPSPAWVAVT